MIFLQEEKIKYTRKLKGKCVHVFLEYF